MREQRDDKDAGAWEAETWMVGPFVKFKLLFIQFVRPFHPHCPHRPWPPIPRPPIVSWTKIVRRFDVSS